MTGQKLSTNDAHGDLLWQGRVLSADSLRRRLNGHQRVLIPPGTVVTPLAAEELRAGGVALEVQRKENQAAFLTWAALRIAATSSCRVP